ncbi:MAG: ABC transporter ATP-binding protein [Evtepia sp.]
MMRMAATGKKQKLDKDTVKRLLHYFSAYKFRTILVAICILLSAAASVASSLFLQTLIDDYIAPLLLEATPVFGPLLHLILVMSVIYLVGVFAAFLYTRIMAVVAQGILRKIRDDMFAHMQSLPIQYFDTHSYGDIMSHYTNDTDTLRQMISQSLPQTFSSLVTIITVFCAMLSISVWLTLFVVVFVVLMMKIAKLVVRQSGKHFIAQQESLGNMNGFIEEMMNGQKVIKIFCHEKNVISDFDKKNQALFEHAAAANTYANVLMPIMNTLGYILYVLLAIVGGAMAILGITNLSMAGFNVLSLGMIASFLQLSRSFVTPISQVSQQINSVVMAIAGSKRIFQLLDEPSEADTGSVRLVHAVQTADGLSESPTRTGLWAWKKPQADGSFTYVELKGDIVFTDVDFAYEENKPVLHDISLYAEPGQKIAFVGATGAGKTTITNLINRFYDIADGKIRYDGININKIKKSDLRRSLGIVLQEVNLFTGTVMDNIRYGKLDASDEDCIAAAKLANADSFIALLPKGYQTVLTGDGSGLSQGQRQLISIARAAVADPPVMILDEATSSIDTRTEAIVQRGMDSLMEGRTVFVIAHRLSTILNSDVIMVLDHGRIVERGSHDHLMSEKGLYYQLYTGASAFLENQTE